MSYNQSHGLTLTIEDPDGMRIECPHCEEKAAITGHNKLSPAVKDVYASCTSPACGWRGVITVSHKHDIQPPREQFRSMLAELISALPAEERAELLGRVG